MLLLCLKSLGQRPRCERMWTVVHRQVCYRKYGHNEIDEPMFTQPALYSKIKQHKSSMEQYVDRLLSEKTFTQAEVNIRAVAYLRR